MTEGYIFCGTNSVIDEVLKSQDAFCNAVILLWLTVLKNRVNDNGLVETK